MMTSGMLTSTVVASDSLQPTRGKFALPIVNNISDQIVWDALGTVFQGHDQPVHVVVVWHPRDEASGIELQIGFAYRSDRPVPKRG
jgi:hypothetical protein